MQHYKKIILGNLTIEFLNSWSGKETVLVNGKTVSKKSSVWGTNHHFEVFENGRSHHYILTTKVNSFMQVFIDLRKNGHYIKQDLIVQPGGPSKAVKRKNKAKLEAIKELEEYHLDAALKGFKKAQNIDPNDGEIHFYQACIYSVLEKTTEGFEALKKAVENGFKDESRIKDHDMLAFLRLNEGFEEFVQSGYKTLNPKLKRTKKQGVHTCHSEYGKIKSIFIKKAKDAFLDDYTLQQNWRDLNYLDKPDFRKALQEYDQFTELLVQQGSDIHYFPYDYSVGMDSMYCRDASIATDAGIILCNMGKAQRSHEPIAAEKAYKAAGIKILGQIKSPGTLEGGDVAWLDESTLAVAHGYRTNQAGFDQLKTLVEPLGVELLQVPLPHYKGPADVFHLMSIFSPVDKDLAVVYSPLMPVFFRNELLERGYRLVEVPYEEFETMGCNVLAIAPRTCIMVKGNPLTKQRLEAANCTIYEYEGTEISVKGGGGPTCLTRPLLRQS